MADFEIVKDNTKEVLKAKDAAKRKVLEMIGIKAEKYAKALCPVGTPESTGKKGYRGGTLRNSITHQIMMNALSDDADWRLIVGTNVEYAPYVELGTGPYFTPPPEWEQFSAPRGSGAGHGYVHPRPYLRPAIEDHKGEYADIIKKEFKG